MNGVDDIKEYLETWQSCRSLALVKSKRSAEADVVFFNYISLKNVWPVSFFEGK